VVEVLSHRKISAGADKSAPEKSVSVQPLPVVNAGDMSSRVSVHTASRLKSSQRAVQSNPQNFSAYVEMGDIYSHRWDRDAAASEAYENALLIKPKQVDIQLKLGRKLGRLR
jgi:hypothetical protein